MKPGQAGRKTFAQRCHGTQALITRFDPATGKIGMPMSGNHGTEDVYARHGQQLRTLHIDKPTASQLGTAIETQPTNAAIRGRLDSLKPNQDAIDTLIASIQVCRSLSGIPSTTAPKPWRRSAVGVR